MRFRLSSIAAGSLALLGLVAGCGSGASSTGTTSSEAGAPGPAMAAYIAKADALCKAENHRLAKPSAELEAVLREAQSNEELASAAAPLREFGAEVKQGLANLEALEAPAAQRAQVEAMIATETRQVDLFGELVAAFEAEDKTSAQIFENRLVASKKRYGEQTAELGFKVCGLRSR
jgi:hypothetical protein